MTLREYMAILRIRWGVVVVGFLLGLGVAGSVTMITPQQFSADVSMYVSTPVGVDSAASAYQGSLLSEQRMESYVQLVTSQRIGRAVVEQLRLAEKPDDVTRKITARATPGTVILTITVTDPSSQRAAQIANAVAAAFTRLVTQLEQPRDQTRPAVVTAEIIDPAIPSVSEVSPQPVRNMVLGAILGLFVGFAAVLSVATISKSIGSSGESSEPTEPFQFKSDRNPSTNANAPTAN